MEAGRHRINTDTVPNKTKETAGETSPRSFAARVKDRHCNDCGKRIPRKQDANICTECLWAIFKDSGVFDL